jgi:pimeloyl-ACP methyl ester carboxylesterase
MAEPFAQLPFAALPGKPTRPHAFFELPARDITVRSAPFGEVRVRYREAGEGPPLVLVHGLMTTSYSYRYVIHRFAERHRTIAFDLVGAGESDKPDRHYGPRELATFIAEVLETFELRGADVVGNSLGGYLCMWTALEHPGSIGRLVNIHSPGVPLARLHALKTAMAVPGATRLLDALIRRDPQRWAHRNVHYYDESLKSREEAATYGAPLATAEGRRAFAHYLSDALDPRAMRVFVAELEARRRFPVPLALFYARRDPMVPPVVGEKLAALVPDATFSWLDDCSHFAHIDRPDLVVDAVETFLSATDPAAHDSQKS